MGIIDPNLYPLFDRMAGGLFQGLSRSFSSDEKLGVFLLEFFRRDELEPLLAELKEIASKNLSDQDWEEYWYSSLAQSVPRDAKTSSRLVRVVMNEIAECLKRNHVVDD